MLSTLLILADAEREDGTILTRPLEAPIFIAGLPRGGTTSWTDCWRSIPPNALRVYGRRSTPIPTIALPLSQPSRGRVWRRA
jgi:hypothetical protein